MRATRGAFGSSALVETGPVSIERLWPNSRWSWFWDVRAVSEADEHVRFGLGDPRAAIGSAYAIGAASS